VLSGILFSKTVVKKKPRFCSLRILTSQTLFFSWNECKVVLVFPLNQSASHEIDEILLEVTINTYILNQSKVELNFCR